MKLSKKICFAFALSTGLVAHNEQTPPTIIIRSTHYHKPIVTSEVICGKRVKVESVAQFSDTTQSSHHTAFSPEEQSSCSANGTDSSSKKQESTQQLAVNVVENYSPTFELKTEVDMRKPQPAQVNIDPVHSDQTVSERQKPEKVITVKAPQVFSNSWSLGSLGLLAPKLFLGGICVCYGAALTTMLYASHVTLAKTDTWSSWKQHIPVHALRNAESSMAKELFTDIQKKYANDKKETSFLNPLVQFYNDVDSETEQLKKFIKLHEWANRLKIAALFPCQEQALQLAVQKINRLDALKKLVITSITEYKVNA